MESLLSPVLAAVTLLFMTFNWLFVGTSIGFVVSALLVLSTRIPNANSTGRNGAWERISSGITTFVRTPRLRGLLALNLVVAAVGSIVVVNTVNCVRDQLGGGQADVAWMLAASGVGTLIVAFALPRILDRVADRAVMMTGVVILLLAVTGAVAMFAAQVALAILAALIRVLIGAGMALIVTPAGRVIPRSNPKEGLPGAFAAQFPLSHLAWLITYPIAGWLGALLGLTFAWSILGILAVAGGVAAWLVWARERGAAAPAITIETRAPQTGRNGRSRALPE